MFTIKMSDKSYTSFPFRIVMVKDFYLFKIYKEVSLHATEKKALEMLELYNKYGIV